MPLHENFKEYTDEEIVKIKNNVCLKHKCPYLDKKYATLKKVNGKKIVTNPMTFNCNYILYTGHMRGYMPDDCKHWKDKNVNRRRFCND